MACAQSQASGYALFDRQTLEDVFAEDTSTPTAQASTETVAGEELQEEPPDMEYSGDAWNHMRDDAERGTLPSEETSASSTATKTSTAAASNEPIALPPSLEMPNYGTSMSVTGRKTIGFNYSSKHYLYDQTTSRAQTLSTFDLQQQLQVKIEGKMGPKITTNVDYDDSRTDKQDISIVYKGDQDEVVQNASFGDIDLSLPSSEFVQYNKQLFGIRMDIKYKNFQSTLIGSRTKGATKTVEFTGNSSTQSKDISDVSYIRRTYYDVAFGSAAVHLPIKANSEKIYLDNQSYTASNNSSVVQMTVDDMGIQTSSYTGNFRLLSRGVDYTMDYTNGIVTFASALSSQYVVALNYICSDGTELRNASSTAPYSGGTGFYKLIKTSGDVYISTDPVAQAMEMGWNRELKTYYSFGQTQLVADNGRGNFVLKVEDLSHNYIGSSLNPAQVYSANISVDFTNGMFHLLKPFGNPSYSGSSNPPIDPNIYAASPISKYIIHTEYQARVKTFSLNSRVVPQSETVLMDGSKLTRNVDYYIDYDTGYITFYNESRVQAATKISVTFDVSAYGGLGTDSLIGGRVGYNFNKNVSVGSTVLYQTGTKSATAPSISSVANSVGVYESDLHFNDIKLLHKLKTSIALEGAISQTNPNLNGYAIIDNMENVKDQTTAPLDYHSWQIAANPTMDPADPTALSWNSESVPVLTINPNAQAASSDAQTVLDFTYDLSVSSEVSIVYPFSSAGLDFTNKNLLEMQVYADGSSSAPAPYINIHLGRISNDADGTGGTTLYCADGTTRTNVPKTEDLNCNGVLDVGEDIGWLYAPTNSAHTARYGAGNGKIDTEDLDGSGVMEAQDFTGGDFGYVNGSYFTDLSAGSAEKNYLDYTGWHTLQSTITITTDTAYEWAAIKQVRISLKQAPNGKTKGTIKIAKLAVTGTTWAMSTSTNVYGGNLTLSGVNNVDNYGEYTPIYNVPGDPSNVFNYLYGSISSLQQSSNSSNISEQSMQLVYASTASAPSMVAAQRVFTTPIDVSRHQKFMFLISNPVTAGAEISTSTFFFLRLGSDSQYVQATFPLDFIGWRLITLNQDDLTGDGIARTWTNGSPYKVTVSSAGSVNFQSVSLLTAGIMTTDGANHNGKVWLDEIHVGSPRTATGHAYMLRQDFDWENWAEFGYKIKYTDRNFQTPVSAISNQDNKAETAYFKFKRLSYLPVNADYTHQMTDSPNAVTSNDSTFISELTEGIILHDNANVTATFTKDKLPKMTAKFTFDQMDYELLTRLDKTNTYSGTASYTVPTKSCLLPHSMDFSYSYADSSSHYDSAAVLATAGYYNSDDITTDYGAKLGFVPWKDSTFNPSYTLEKVRESRNDYTSGAPETSSYQKSMQQTASFTSSFKLLSWLTPTANYSVNTIENNNLSVTTVTVGSNTQVFNIGTIKTLNRSANGAVNVNLTASSFLPKGKFLDIFRSMTLVNSYQLQDGDSWNYVEESLNTMGSLWLRSNLTPTNPYASRTNLTLRDTVTSTQKWMPLSSFDIAGRMAPLKTLTITNNYSKSLTRTDVTGTASRVVNTTMPDLVASISQLENMFKITRWATNVALDLKYSRNTAETVSTNMTNTRTYGFNLRFLLFKKIDSLVTGNMKTTDSYDYTTNSDSGSTLHRDATVQGAFEVGKFRLTPKVDYNYDQTMSASDVLTQDVTTITPAFSARGDFATPKGLLLPFMKKPLLFTNRIIWTSTLSFAIKRSPLTEEDNSNLLNFTTIADCELSKNLRLAINGAAQRLWHLYLPSEEYISFTAGSTMTLQF
jgi:hypothetical protein